MNSNPGVNIDSRTESLKLEVWVYILRKYKTIDEILPEKDLKPNFIPLGDIYLKKSSKKLNFCRFNNILKGIIPFFITRIK